MKENKAAWKGETGVILLSRNSHFPHLSGILDSFISLLPVYMYTHTYLHRKSRNGVTLAIDLSVSRLPVLQGARKHFIVLFCTLGLRSRETELAPQVTLLVMAVQHWTPGLLVSGSSSGPESGTVCSVFQALGCSADSCMPPGDTMGPW